MALRDVLDRIGRQATDIAPARVLLLTRAGVAGERDPLAVLEQDATPLVRHVIGDSDSSDAATERLTRAQRDALYDAAVEAFAIAWQVERTTAPVDLSAVDYGLPLEVLFEALDQTLTNGDGGSRTLAPPSGPVVHPVSPVQRVLAHEAKYWAVDCPVDDPALRRACVGLATLAGAAEADALLALLPELNGGPADATRLRVITWLAALYGGDGLLNPLRPYRLGEWLVGTALREHHDPAALLSAVLSLDSDDQVANALEVLARMATYDRTAATVLGARHTELVERADRPAAVRLANALIQMHSGLVAVHIADATPVERIRELRITYGRLGDIAARTGQGAAAETLHRRSLAIDQRLTAAEPGNTVYQRDLSISYNKLADLAVAAGQGDEARRLFTQALSIRQGLAEAEPGNTVYQRDLSISYERLADLGLASGQNQEAWELVSGALDLRRTLATGEPHRVDLAVELAYTLYLASRIEPDQLDGLTRELIELLGPFEAARTITSRGRDLFTWARDRG